MIDVLGAVIVQPQSKSPEDSGEATTARADTTVGITTEARVNHPPDGARLKIDRAQEHLDSLKAEVRMYVDTHPYEIFKNKHSTGHEFPDVRVTSQPPIRLSAIVGDVVVNARAALDR